MRSQRRILPLVLLLLTAGPALAQRPQAGKRPPIVDPPAGPLRAATPPPPGPVHCVAEWEESEGVMLRWKNADLIRKLLPRTTVYIPVDGPQDQAAFEAWLASQGIPLADIRFLPIRTDSIYTRDYGPWFVWDVAGDLGIVDYTPSYGFWDDQFPLAFAGLHGIAYYDSGLNHVGGNYLPNGYDVAFSSTHVYEQNGLSTKASVDRAMQRFFGIDPYRTVAPKSIWHHDTWGKPCAPDTLIVVDFPEDELLRHRAADDTAAFYATLESPWGRPYRILRLPMFRKSGQLFRPYMNSLISNRAVYVPVDGVPDDRIALDVFQRAFPGYEIVAVDSQGCFHFDALHCRTRNFVRRDPVRVYPHPPGDSEDTATGYPVEAEVLAPKGSALLAGQPVLHFSETGGAPFQAVAMVPTTTPDRYRAVLPPRPHGTTLSFFVEARDTAGCRGVYPPVAPDGLMSLEVRADTQAPRLSRLLPARSASVVGWPPRVRVLATDDMATPRVRLEYAVNGQQQPDVLLQREEGTYWYSGGPAPAAAPGDLVTYHVVASDGSAAGNEDRLPPVGEIFCSVTSTTRIAVVDMSHRPVTAPYLVEALGGLGLPCTVYSDWPDDWGAHDVWLVCLGVFADNHVLTADQALDLVGALKRGRSIYLEGGDTWCYDAQGTTLAPWFGVTPVSRGPSCASIEGQPGTLAEGLAFTYVAENLLLDRIAAASGSELLLASEPGTRGRAVLHDAGTYRTIAASFALGGLMDDGWPSTRKELLVRALEFLGVDPIRLTVSGQARPGETVELRLEAAPGDEYVLLGSWADHHAAVPGLGTLRIDPAHAFRIARGVVPAEGVVLREFELPRDAALLDAQVLFQAVAGPQLTAGSARLTNRDVVTVVE